MASLPPLLPSSKYQNINPYRRNEDLMYCSELVKKFDIFYEENINKCSMKDSNRKDLKSVYPINHDLKNQWRDNMLRMNPGDKNVANFVLTFVKYLEYIPIVTFYHQCSKIGNEICEKIHNFQERYPTGVNSILVISGTIDKSNLWTSLLMYKTFRGKITHITNHIAHAVKLYQNSNKIPTQIFYVDDCSYSGEQLSKSAGNDGIPEEKTLEVYAAVCYVSLTARNIFKTAGIKCFDTSIIFYSMEYHLIKDNLEFTNKWNNMYNPELHMLYFDHKVADGVSVFDKILRTGEYLNWEVDKQSKPVSFIRGCENTTKTCPPSFYQVIHYTYKGRPVIKNNSVIDIDDTSNYGDPSNKPFKGAKFHGGTSVKPIYHLPLYLSDSD